MGNSLETQKDYVHAAAITKDGTSIIFGVGNTIKIYDIEIKTDLYSFENAHEGAITALVISPCGKILVSGSADKSVKIFDLEKREEIKQFKDAHEKPVESVAVSPDGKFAVSASTDNLINIFDLNTTERIFTLKREGYITSVVFTTDSKNLIVGGSEFCLKMFNFETKEVVHKFTEEPQKNLADAVFYSFVISALAVSPDNKILVTGGLRKNIKVYDLHTKKQIHTFHGVHQDKISSLAISRDNKLLVSGSYDGFIKAFNLETKEELTVYDIRKGKVSQVIISPNQKYVVAVGGSSQEGKGRGFLEVIELKKLMAKEPLDNLSTSSLAVCCVQRDQ